MKRASVVIHVTVLVAVTLLDIARAGLVYNNGVPNMSNAIEMGAIMPADDFYLSAPTVITDVRFWAGGWDDPYSGSIVWSMYAENAESADQPGALLYRGSVVPVRTYDRTQWSRPFYQHDFSVGSLTLEPGIYWLGLHNGPLSAFYNQGYYWDVTNPNGSLLSCWTYPSDDASWSTFGDQLAFQLYDTPAQVVPAPAAVLLGTLGLSIAGWRLRRQAT